MNCPKCNKILDDGATYCMSCGIRVDDPEANQEMIRKSMPPKKSKKKLIALIIVSLIVILLIVGIIITLLISKDNDKKEKKEKEELEKKENFVTVVNSFYETIKKEVASNEKLNFFEKSILYLVPVGSVSNCDQERKSPYSDKWNYAYIGVVDSSTGYEFYFIGEDSTGVGVTFDLVKNIKKEKIYDNYKTTNITEEASSLLKKYYEIDRTYVLKEKLEKDEKGSENPKFEELNKDLKKLLKSKKTTIEKIVFVSDKAGCKYAYNESIPGKKKESKISINDVYFQNNNFTSGVNGNVSYFTNGKKVLNIEKDYYNGMQEIEFYVYDIDDNYSFDNDIEIINNLVEPDISKQLKTLISKFTKIIKTAYKKEDPVLTQEFKIIIEDIEIEFDYKQDYQGNRKILTYYIKDNMDNGKQRVTEKAVITDFDTYFDETNTYVKSIYGKDLSNFKELLKKEFNEKNTSDFEFWIKTKDLYFQISINPALMTSVSDFGENEYYIMYEYTDDYDVYEMNYFLKHKATDKEADVRKYLKEDFERIKEIYGIDLTGSIDTLTTKIMEYWKDQDCSKKCDDIDDAHEATSCYSKCPDSYMSIDGKYYFRFPKKNEAFEVAITKMK